MANLIQTASVFQTELDKAVIVGATTGWMEPNSELIKYDGGKEVKIPKLILDGLGDYNNGAPEGSITLEYETKSMEMDRGRKFLFDEHAVTETNFVLTASSVLGEFQNKKVIPEIDAYRYSTIASGAITKSKASGGYTPSENDILKKLYYDIARVQDSIGSGVQLIITLSPLVLAILSSSTSLSKKISETSFSKGNIDLKVNALDGMHPIISASSGLLKSKFVFYDGRTASDGATSNPTPDQRKGGFVPTDDAKNINWIISAKTAPIAVSRTDNPRIFDPNTYQDSRSWCVDYRKYHDLWIAENQWNNIFVNFKENL